MTVWKWCVTKQAEVERVKSCSASVTCNSAQAAVSWVPHTLGKWAQVQQKVQKGSPWYRTEAYSFHAQNNGPQNKVTQWNINLKLFFSSEGPGVPASIKNLSTFTLCIETFLASHAQKLILQRKSRLWFTIRKTLLWLTISEKAKTTIRKKHAELLDSNTALWFGHPLKFGYPVLFMQQSRLSILMWI